MTATDISKDRIERVEKERGTWSNHCDFFLSMLGMCVGLGNIWRFPYLCYAYGGGGFLVPYTVMLFIAGIPVFYLELALGQYVGAGPVTLFKNICPLFKGIGFGMLVILLHKAIYYTMVIAWTVFYTFASFQSDLPWRICDRNWAGPTCYSPDQDSDCQDASNGTNAFYNGTCTEKKIICESNYNLCADEDCERNPMSYWNETYCLNNTANNIGEEKFMYIKIKKAIDYVLPAEEYFHKQMLQISGSFEDFGYPQWQLVLCLLFSWIVCGASIIKGVKSSGKVVYVTAVSPYILLTILLVKGLTLDGAYDGITFYMQPDWSALKSLDVWAIAAQQIFYTLGISLGNLETISSYCHFNNNCQRDALFIAIANCASSVFAGFAIFSIIGHMAFILEVPVSDVITSGPGLTFIAYPQALAQMPLAPLWSVLFFITLFTLGLDSQFVMAETLVTAICDEFPKFRHHKMEVVGAVCFACFLPGIFLCTPGGMYLFYLMDRYASGISLLVIALFTLGVCVYAYGYENLEKNIIEMIGKRALLIAWYWKWTWRVLAPLVTAGTLVFSFVTFGRTSYRDYQYNWWAEMIGWVVTFSSIGMVPFFALQSYLRARRRGQNVMMLLRPTAQWGSGILEMIKSADDLESKNKLSFHNRVVDLIAKPDEQQTSAF